MLPFEIAIVTCTAAVALIFVIAGKAVGRPLLWILLAGTFGILLWHVDVEWRHWQMWPYLISVCVLAFVFLSRHSSAKKIRFLAAASLALLASSVAAAIVLPMFQLPKATGPYRVGTTVLHLVDRNRPEEYSNDSAARRELNIQVWYPTSATKGKDAPYRRPAETTFLSRYQAAIPTEALEDVPVAVPNGPNAVVVFNHAWNGLRTQDTFETIDLASHGFVVVSIDHTYNAIRTAFPDGRILTAQSGDLDDFRRESPALLFARANRELHTESADDSFVIDTLQQWNADPSNAFYGKLDLSRVGVMGHSFGGAVAVQTAISDDRVRSAINMDGWVFGDFTTTGLQKPLLQMIDDEPFPTPADFASSDPTIHGYACFNGILLASMQTSFEKNGGYLLRMRGAKHMDFSDRPLFSPFRKLTSSGVGNWRSSADDIRSYTLRFFQRTLLSKDVPMSDAAGGDPGLSELTAWPPGQTLPQLRFTGSLQNCGVNVLARNSAVQEHN